MPFEFAPPTESEDQSCAGDFREFARPQSVREDAQSRRTICKKSGKYRRGRAVQLARFA